MNFWCKIGWHKNIIIGTAYNPFMKGTVIVAYGCERCGKKSKKGAVMSEEDSRLK